MPSCWFRFCIYDFFSKLKAHVQDTIETLRADGLWEYRIHPEVAAVAKNIVVCCDGTNNEFGAANTNVAHILSLASKRADSQIAFTTPALELSAHLSPLPRSPNG
jgi:Uncharacterized alpha/beta hydrolase domain (DUF2235)